MIPDGDIRSEELMEIWEKCAVSTRAYCEVFLKEHFYRPIAKAQEKIFEILDDDSVRRAAIIAPRGIGKTTIFTLAYPSKALCYRQRKFIVPVSCTATVAKQQSDNLRNELISNTLIKKVFGKVKPSSNVEGLDDSFSKESWVTDWGSLVVPRGADQQVRGMKFGRFRPDLGIVDDLEDPKHVKSEEQRQANIEWFFASFLNIVDIYDEMYSNPDQSPWKIVVIGTLLHQDSLVARLMDDSGWETARIELCNDQFKSCFPEWISDEQIQVKADDYRRQKIMDVFYREFRGLPVAAETATFKQEHFNHYRETDEKFIQNILPKLECGVIVDPAKTAKFSSADTAIVGFGVDTNRNAIYIRDIISDKLHPEQIYSETIKMARALNARVIGCEITSLHEFIEYPFQNAIYESGLGAEFVSLKARDSKETRSAWLAPFYRKGQVYHNINVCSPLEVALLEHPNCRKWDVLDATAYIIELLEKGDKYFTFEGGELDEYDIEREFEEIEYDPDLDYEEDYALV